MSRSCGICHTSVSENDRVCPRCGIRLTGRNLVITENNTPVPREGQVPPSILRYKNPQNGHIEESAYCWAYTLLFGPCYFAFKGIWGHFFAHILLSFATFSLSWFAYPFFANKIVRNHYGRMGWIDVTEEESQEHHLD